MSSVYRVVGDRYSGSFLPDQPSPSSLPGGSSFFLHQIPKALSSIEEIKALKIGKELKTDLFTILKADQASFLIWAKHAKVDTSGSLKRVYLSSYWVRFEGEEIRYEGMAIEKPTKIPGREPFAQQEMEKEIEVHQKLKATALLTGTSVEYERVSRARPDETKSKKLIFIRLASMDMFDFMEKNGSEPYNGVTLKHLKEILEELNRFHSHGFLHGDIKMENILIMPDGKIKFCDLSTVCLVEENKRPRYFFPDMPYPMRDIYKNTPSNDLYGVALAFICGRYRLDKPGKKKINQQRTLKDLFSHLTDLGIHKDPYYSLAENMLTIAWNQTATLDTAGMFLNMVKERLSREKD
jgi:serine/threonine protein kinase